MADLVVTRAGEQLVTTANEAERLNEEALGNLNAELVVLPWTQATREALPTGARVGYDLPMPGDRDVAHLVEQVRRSLTSAEMDRFRTLGRDSAMALTEACTAIQPRHTEHDAAAHTASAFSNGRSIPLFCLSQVRSASLIIVIRFPPPHPSAESQWWSSARVDTAWSQV